MERKIVQKPNKFKVGQITFCNGGCTMQLPTFYKVVKKNRKNSLVNRTRESIN